MGTINNARGTKAHLKTPYKKSREILFFCGGWQRLATTYLQASYPV